MKVKVAGPHVNVWDREQGDPKKGLVIPTTGEAVEVETTQIIMAALNDKRLVEVKDEPKPAEGGKAKDKDKE